MQEGVGFNTTVLNGTALNVAFILAQEEKIIKAGNITFNVAKDTTKWSLQYQGWPFQNETNQLRLVLRYASFVFVALHFHDFIVPCFFF